MLGLIIIMLIESIAVSNDTRSRVEITKEQAEYWQQSEEFLFVKDITINFLVKQLQNQQAEANAVVNERIVTLKIDSGKKYKLLYENNKIYLEEITNAQHGEQGTKANK